MQPMKLLFPLRTQNTEQKARNTFNNCINDQKWYYRNSVWEPGLMYMYTRGKINLHKDKLEDQHVHVFQTIISTHENMHFILLFLSPLSRFLLIKIQLIIMILCFISSKWACIFVYSEFPIKHWFWGLLVQEVSIVFLFI